MSGREVGALATLPARLVAHWRFDEGSGTTTADATGNGNIGTLQGGPTWVTRGAGYALSFDGVDDIVKVSATPSIREITNDFTVAFWANPQATHEIDNESTSGASGTSGQKYAIDARQGGVTYGSPDHACAGVSVGTNGISVYEHSDYYMPALLVHQAPISGWTHVAVVYRNRQPRLYVNGTLVRTGLKSPKTFVHINPEALGGMGYGPFQGQLDAVHIYEHALSPGEIATLVTSNGDTVWVEDAVPAGAVLAGDSEGWNWVRSNPAPYSGTVAHQSNSVAGMHQHYFYGASEALPLGPGDRLFAYVYLDPANTPTEVMLQWHDGTGWEHRAYWGANQINRGTDGTASRRNMGPLPPAGSWVRLEVPAGQVGLEGKTVSGTAFTLFGGRATWDRAGHSPLQALLPQELRAAGFKITEQLSEAELSDRANLVESLFGDITNPHAAPSYLKEVIYFVPMQLALQLQQSRHYTAALDWFRTVYAYNLPEDQRKVYYGLELEHRITSSYERVPDKWLLNDELNPHKIVKTRADAYTRFTLLSFVRCFLDFADSEFTTDTGESLSRARSLYLSALDLLNLPELEWPKQAKDLGFAPNPVPQALRLHAELNLFKLRDNRNIAGMQRQAEPALAGVPAPRPTPYRYSALVERAKQLVALAQQIEAAYLSALEKRDAETYNLLNANQDLELADASIELKKLRVKEASDSEELASLQKERAQTQKNKYQEWIDAELNQYEQTMITSYNEARDAQITIARSSAFMQYMGVVSNPSSAAFYVGGTLAALALGESDPIMEGFKASMAAAYAQTRGQVASIHASHERRKQEWELQKSLAQKDIEIGGQQVLITQDHTRVVEQERNIAVMQSEHAKAVVDFLGTKFTNAELYAWMSGVLGRVYGYFLQQSTAVAQLAQSQLAFERQETPPSFIQADYWRAPSDFATNGSADGQAADRRGLTGSARLLQDIYQLDQHAFETDKRKLQLTKTISLARLAPFEFQRFRETGVLPFATPMEMFDQDFPGHYLRLIKRIRTSVIALIPPTQGIHATLSSPGVSRVTTGGEAFQTVPVRRDPEQVALSSPSNATGLFELDQQSNMLLPFEAMGVDTSWEFRMPKAANPFDYRTIADVLITIEYTALDSFAYRQEVIQRLDRTIGGDRSFSLRQQFADQWYDLHNPDQTPQPMAVSFETIREDFPPNIEDLTIQQIVLYVVRSSGEPFAPPLKVDLRFTPQAGTEDGGEASSEDGVFSTRRGNAEKWRTSIVNKYQNGTVPYGTWKLTLPNTNDVKNLFKKEEIEDILFVITYSGTTPEWPA